MALPAGISTATVTVGVPVTFSGLPVRTNVTITPSAFLVHTATGHPLVNMIEEATASDGVAVQFTLPHTDQDGFQDEAGNTYKNWYYTASIQYATDKATKPAFTKVFQLASGQSLVDLDLLPGGNAAMPYSAPLATVTSVAGQTGAVSALSVLEDPEAEAALNATIATATADKLSAAPEVRAPEPLVAFTFDDGPIEDLTVIKPILDARGVKGVFAINSGNVGTSGAKLSWAQVRQLRDEGHEIIDHSATHANLNTTDTAVLAAQIDDSYDKFVTEGIRPVGFCWPFADSSPTSRAAVRRYYRYALGGAGGTTQPLHTYAIKRVEINDATSLATHQAQINAAVTNKELLIFLVHAGTTGSTGLTLLGQVIDYAKASAAAVVTTAEAFDRVGNIVDTGDLPGAVSYMVVDGQGRLKTSDGSAVLVGAINPLASAAPNTYKAGVVTFQRVSGPANTDWPNPGNAGKIETDRIDTTNPVYTVQEFKSYVGNIKLTRRATSDTAWGPWYGDGSLGSDANAGNLTPESFPIGTVNHTVPLSGSTGPSGKQGLLTTTRGSATIHTYTTQVFHEVSNATMHRRMGATATTWSAWKVVTLT